MPPRARRPLPAHARPGDLGRQRDLRPRARARAGAHRRATSTWPSCRRSRRTRATGSRRSSPTTTRARRRPSAGFARWAAATLRPAPLRSLLEGVDVVHYPLTVPVPRPTGPHVITLLDVQHLDLPELFSRGERLFRKLAYDRAARGAAEVIVISEFVRGAGRRAARSRPRARPRGVARRRSRALHAGARGRARAAAAVPRPAVAAQEPRAAARGVRARSAGGGRSSASCSPGSATTGARCRRASRRAPSRARSSSSSTGARPASSSRASTRDSACRPSRRWRVAALLPPRRPARCPRCAAMPPSSSTRSTPRRSPRAIDEALDALRRAERSEGCDGRRRSRGTRRPARTTGSTRTFS